MTKFIEVDEDVVAALFSKSLGFHDNENAVLRRLLQLPPAHLNQSDTSDSTDTEPVLSASPILTFVRSPKFRSLSRGLDKYLGLLGWLHQKHTSEFEEIENLPLGGRKYFAKNEADIRAKANGAVSVKRIPQSDFWALTTLSNDSKKNVINRVLQFLGYLPPEASAVLKEFPDSESRNAIDL